MTEAEWLDSGDPAAMLEFLRGKVSDRKLRLFACACCHRVERLGCGVGSVAVDRAERFADGLETEQDLRAALADLDTALADDAEDLSVLWRARWVGHDDLRWQWAGKAARRAADLASPFLTSAVAAATEAARAVAEEASYPLPEYEKRKALQDLVVQQERVAQCHLLRDLFANPFRAVVVEDAWLRWNDTTIPKFARGIYDERAFDRLLILADALEDAGCDNADILAHCRGPGPHVRGCWVVDLILGKQ